ncbi:Bug family tripartite tricarboxylate transporter substrate binding protein [Candidimonas nitroreducens]|uniref:ABC transporter substrate-binding protein n=1 Tax=Candidimonas nitroreducens TaxID=683354 RepID=A0A225M918_9BURK|nr:tripartite tricarboxylate transporter substrate binding protein [Candidimonas nitroreducens]OWT56743.1 ABC transporter substrate-binding protein [Candidimonas nitroreducens]
MDWIKRIVAMPIFALCLCAATFQSVAQGGHYPDKPIHWIIPNAAGGGTDVLARLLAQSIGPALGQPIVIENKPGAASMIGAGILARSKPDGYTMLTGDNATFATNEHLYEHISYNPAKDFSYVSLIARFPLALIARPSFPASNIRQLITYVKAHPGKVTFATPGVGLPHHLAMELFMQREGLNMVHVPYKGSPAAIQAMLAGDVDVMFVDLASGYPFIAEGKVKAYALASAHRFPTLPELATMSEAGIPNFEVYAWQGVVVPAGTPAPVVARLNKALHAAVNDPSVHKHMIDLGVEPITSSPQEFYDYARSESKRWGTLIAEKKLRAQ